MGEVMKIFSSKKCLKESVIFTLEDKILKEQVMNDCLQILECMFIIVKI